MLCIIEMTVPDFEEKLPNEIFITENMTIEQSENLARRRLMDRVHAPEGMKPEMVRSLVIPCNDSNLGAMVNFTLQCLTHKQYLCPCCKRFMGAPPESKRLQCEMCDCIWNPDKIYTG